MSLVHPIRIPAVTVAVRRAFARHRWLYPFVVASLAVGAAALTHARLSEVERARDGWGSTRSVLVATRALAPGEPVATTSRRFPVAMIPDGAITDPAGLVARQRIGAGEIVTRTAVGVGDGPLALVPDGWIAVPTIESIRSGAVAGERVGVVADGLVLTSDAVVVGHVDDVTLLAVRAGDAEHVAAAAELVGLVLLRSP